MIGSLRGVLTEKNTPDLLVECSGVGYEVSVPLSTFYELPERGASVFLLVQHIVREDASLLFGFATRSERDLFRELIKVNGVGPKLALTILSGLPPAQFAACILAGDSASLVKMPGVGKKTAERLVVDLKDRVAKIDIPVVAGQAAPARPAAAKTALDDAESALVSLGYKPADASKVLAGIAEADTLSVEQLIKQALRALSN